MSFNVSSQQGMGEVNGRVAWFSFWQDTHILHWYSCYGKFYWCGFEARTTNASHGLSSSYTTQYLSVLSTTVFRPGWKMPVFCTPPLLPLIPNNTVRVHSNKILFLCVNVPHYIIIARYGEGKWVGDLVHFLVGHTQPPLLFIPWHIFLMWFFI